MAKMKLEMATESDKKGGWTLSTVLLDAVQDKITDYDDAPSWEGIELVLLAFHGMELPRDY